MNEVAYAKYQESANKAKELFDTVKELYATWGLKENLSEYLDNSKLIMKAFKDGLITKDEMQLLKEFYT